MIRTAAAYATAATIGAVVGTFTGTIFGIVVTMLIIDDDKKATLASLTKSTNEPTVLEPIDVQLDDVDLNQN